MPFLINHSIQTRFILPILPLLLTQSMSMSNTKIIDSHLHIWGDGSAPYPFASEDQIPPDALKQTSSVSDLLQNMDSAGVDGCMIVQPINYKFDHSYVADVIAEYPEKFKGMMLFDPSVKVAEDAVKKVEQLLLQGFVGVRFNPYMFDGDMSEDGSSGLAVYKKCAELKVPVGVMCFKGLGLHFDDIVALIKKSPDTTLILDHFGFTRLMLFNENDDPSLVQEDFDKLLSLAQYPNVYIKISALFRIADLKNGEDPYMDLKINRFDPILKAFGCERIMVGTDFPFVQLEEIGYKGSIETVASWCSDDNAKNWVLGGTAERVFGPWAAATS